MATEPGTNDFYQAMRRIFAEIPDPEKATGHISLIDSWEKTWRTFLRTPGNEVPLRLLKEISPQIRSLLTGATPDAAFVTSLPDPMPRRSFGRFLRESIGKVLGSPSNANPAFDSSYEEPVDFPANAKYSSFIGLHDAVESGWFHRERGELFTGFPISSDDVVLDIGCGNGDFSRYCGEFGAHIIFSDIDPKSVRKTERLLAGSAARGITPLVSDANPLPLPDASVSKIIANEVIEHVDDASRFLQELVRVGKPSAQYLLAVPDPFQETFQHQLAPAEFFVKPQPGGGRIRGLSSGHLRTIGRDDFERLIADAGLIVERHEYVGFFWALWFTFFWICDVDVSEPLHPLLVHWTRTWKLLLDLPDGKRVKKALDRFMPKSQIVIARKP
jgi:ubiquinone/menaquinone biosynthesis C-methylase UbiE